MDFCVSFLHQDIPVIPARSYLFHSTWSTRNLPFPWRKACAYPLPVWIPWCLELPLLTCQLWPACQRWYTAWFLTCFFTASCAAGRPMLEPEHGSLASMGEKSSQKKRLLRRSICAMTPWLHDPDLSRSQTSLQTAPRSCALKSHTSTRCGMISPPHSPTKKTHCEVSTSEPAQEVSLHLTGDNSWNCLSQHFVSSRFIVPESDRVFARPMPRLWMDFMICWVSQRFWITQRPDVDRSQNVSKSLHSERYPAKTSNKDDVHFRATYKFKVA